MQNLDATKEILIPKRRLRPPRYHKKDILIPKRDAPVFLGQGFGGRVQVGGGGSFPVKMRKKGKGVERVGGGGGTGKGTGKRMRTRLSKLPFSKLPFSFSPKKARVTPGGGSGSEIIEELLPLKPKINPPRAPCRFIEAIFRTEIGFGKRGLLEKRSFQKSPSSRDFREFRDSREPPERGKKNHHFLEVLRI